MRAAPRFVFALCLLTAAALASGPSPSAAKPGGTTAARSICPTIVIECPETAASGAQVTVTAKVSVNAFTNLTFKWTASAGTITPESEEVINASNATRAAVVDTTGVGDGSAVTTTFEVTGLDRTCADTSSCTTLVRQIRAPHPLDVYGNIRFEDEKARLDNFVIELQGLPEMNGYIVCYGGRAGVRGEARARCERAKRYLTAHRGMSPDRLVLVDGGFQERLTVWLWILPAGTNFTPYPTVKPSEVRFTDAPKRRRRAASKRD